MHSGVQKEVIFEAMWHAMWDDYDVDLRFVPFVNRSGGVVSIWSKWVFECSNHFLGNGYVGVEGRWRENDAILVVDNVYCPGEINDKKIIWEEIREKKQQWHWLMVCGGRF